MTAETARRPLKVRERTWPRQLAFALVRRGLTPNQISVASAVITAYVRVFGGSAGLTQDYSGPMAKQQRMAALTIACVLSAAETMLGQSHRVMWLALVVILLGTLFTSARRTARIAALLNAR